MKPRHWVLVSAKALFGEKMQQEKEAKASCLYCDDEVLSELLESNNLQISASRIFFLSFFFSSFPLFSSRYHAMGFTFSCVTHAYRRRI